MGGIGSGRRWYWDAKETVEDYRTIDVRRWHKENMFDGKLYVWRWFRGGEQVSSIQMITNLDQNQFEVSYMHKRINQDWQEQSYPVHLYWSACNYGGKRPWFICPAKNCGRRVAILYLGKIFACRQCYQLAYPCQRENFGYRAIRKIEKVRNKLKWESGCFNGKGLKPKGMHWKTLSTLSIKHDKYLRRVNEWELLRFGILDDAISNDYYF